jgi:hypothetical protein
MKAYFILIVIAIGLIGRAIIHPVFKASPFVAQCQSNKMESQIFITNLLPGEAIVDLIRPNTALSISQLDAVSHQINQILLNIIKKHITSPYIPSDYFDKGVQENFPQYFANYDDNEPWGTCLGDCVDKRHTEIEALAGKGQVVVNLLCNGRDIKLEVILNTTENNSKEKPIQSQILGEISLGEIVPIQK